jgi:hypothetical protein
MSVRKVGRLLAVVGLATGSAVISYPAMAQLYFQPPPPRVYYPPRAAPDELPPPVRSYEERPSARSYEEQPPARSDDGRPSARVTSPQDVPAADANPETRGNNVSGTTTPVHAVSLRDAPSGGSAIIGTLRPGMPLEVLGTNQGWVQVRSSAGTGWAYGSYLASGARGFSPTSAGDVASSPAQAPDVAGFSAAKPTSGGSSAVSASAAPKPPGTANPALAEGGPALKAGASAEVKRGGLASQITSP